MTEPHARLSAATEHDTCRFCGTVASPNDEPNCSTLQQAYAQTPTRPYGCPWFDKDSRKQWPKDRAEMSNLKDPERALVERCRADGFDYTAGCNLVDLVRRAGLTLSFTVAQQAQGCGDPSCQDPNCDYGKQDDALRAEIRSLRIDNARLRDEAAIRALAAQPPAAPVETERKTFTIPPGHEAVRDSEGRATGEVRPRSSADSANDETGWLIEKDDPPVYCCLTEDYDEHWTPDASKALRFARREDAQAYSDHIGWTSPPVRVVEHMWPALKVMPRGGVEYNWHEWSVIYRRRLRKLMKLICNEGYAVSSDSDGMPYALTRDEPQPPSKTGEA